MNMKILTFLLIGLLLLSTFQVFALKENSETITKSITLSPLQIIEDESFSIVAFETPTGMISEVGKPVLPEISNSFTLPFGSRITSIDVSFSNQKQTLLAKPIQPGKTSIPLNEMVYQTIHQPVTYLYEDLTTYPQEQFEYFTSAGRKNNDPVMFLTVLCYPVQYDIQKQTLTYSTSFDITINYVLPQQQVTYLDEFDLVVIAPNEFSIALQPLIAHKNDVGIKTFLKTTEEIYSEYSGVDKPEQIKYFIKDAFDSYGIEFVLLVGGLNSIVRASPRDDANQGTKDWHVPVRYANVITTYDPGLISDLYYADIYDATGNFSSWDTNHDGVFASYKTFDPNKDIIDLMPEVAVGRLACCNVKEVQTVVRKIITYETTAFGSSWEKTFILIGGDTFDDTQDYVEGELETQKSFDYVSGEGYQAIKIWASNRESGGLIPESDDIVSTVSSGAGFVHFAGHGSPELWNTHWVGGPFERSERAEGLKWYHMMKMTNTDEQPIVVIGGCHNSQFNITMSSCLDYWINRIYEITGIEAFQRFEGSVSTPVPECFGWFFISQENGGAIATLGNTGTGIGSTGNIGDRDGDGVDDPDCIEKYGGYLETLYFKSIGVNDVEYVGSAWQDAITMYLTVFPGMKDQTDAKSVEQWVLLGDPSLKIGGYQ
jgi:hypothetical protein